VNALEHLSDLVVGEVVEGVEVGTDGAREKDWILRDDCETCAKVV
jgi:hypothetical protein